MDVRLQSGQKLAPSVSIEPRLKILESLAELRSYADRWDVLWRRSDAAMPTAQAELVAQWIEQFAPSMRFRAIVVEDGDCPLAALPLIGIRPRGLLEVGQLPANSWSPGGELLLDPQADAARALGVMAQGLYELPWPLLWLDEVEWNGPLWYAFRQALWHADRDYSTHHQFDVGLVDVDHDWEGYEARWSQNHRRTVRVGRKRLEEQGPLSFEAHRQPTAQQAEELLREGFEVEDRSWKGPAGSSVLREPGMFEFFVRQARELARRGQLELYLLRHDGRPIAFEYCYAAGGVCYSHKLGYDEAFARFSPGLVLRKLQLARLFACPSVHTFNTMGVLCETKAKWCTRAYSVGRLVVSTGHELSPLLMHAYRGWRYLSPRIGHHQDYLRPKLGAAGSKKIAAKPSAPLAEPVSV